MVGQASCDPEWDRQYERESRILVADKLTTALGPLAEPAAPVDR
jgi:hypothetical protein